MRPATPWLRDSNTTRPAPRSRSSRRPGSTVDLELALFECRPRRPARRPRLRRTAYEATSTVRAADALAWCLHRTGDDRTAAGRAAEALRLGSRDPLLRYHAGAIAARGRRRRYRPRPAHRGARARPGLLGHRRGRCPPPPRSDSPGAPIHPNRARPRITRQIGTGGCRDTLASIGPQEASGPVGKAAAQHRIGSTGRVQSFPGRRRRRRPPDRDDVRVGRPRVEPPRGAVDRRRSGGRQHGPLRVRQPRRPSKLTIVANYIPLQQPGGGPNFHPFDAPSGTRSTSTTTATARTTSPTRFRFTDQAEVWQERRLLVPLQQRSDHVAHRRRPGSRRRLQRQARRRATSARPRLGLRTVPANIGPRSHPELRATSPRWASTRSTTAARSSPVRATMRSSSTSARSSISAAFARSTALHVIPLGAAKRRRRRRRLQHRVDRAPGAASPRSASSASQPVIGVWASAEPARDKTIDSERHASRGPAVGPGLAARQPAHQRGGHPAPSQGLLERPAASQRQAVPEVLRERPSSPVSSTSCTQPSLTRPRPVAPTCR